MKHIILVFLVVLASVSSMACDICSAYSRIQPNDFRHTLGIHFNQRSLLGEIPSGLKHLGHLDGLFSTDEIREVYTALELRGRYRFSDRFAVFGILPVKSNVRFQNGAVREKSSGLGDATGFLEYSPFLAKSDNDFKFILNLRAGVKFPTGETRVKYNEEFLDHDFQLGSGSYDFLLGSEAYVGSESIGLVLSQLYKKNTENLTAYKFGDVYTALGLVTKRWNKKNSNFSLAAGMQIERQWEDEEAETVLEGTDKLAWAGVVKGSFNYKKFELYALTALPIKQEINELQTLPLKQLTQIGINYLIDRK